MSVRPEHARVGPHDFVISYACVGDYCPRQFKRILCRRPREYSFDATETEPPNTNSFFGNGGYAIWVSDNTQQKVRGCISIASGFGTDVSRCVDMKFEP